ncbi:glycosyltransferase [Microbacterium sp. JZ70]
MRALISTYGTRGDVEPYVALARRLVAEGHSAVLAAPEAYRPTVEGTGAEFAPVCTAMHEVMREGMSGIGGPREALGLARRMSAAMRTSLSEQWTAAQEAAPTVMVSHPKALGGLHIAERLGVPFVASLPLPFLTPTRDFPIPFLSRGLPPALNRATYAFNRFTGIAYGGMINRFRTEELGLGRMSRTSDYLHGADGRPVPVLYPFSRHVVPVPRDYPDSAHVTGWWFDRNRDGTPPPELEEFLAADGPVVYIGFGSMGFGRHAPERGRVVLDAVRRVGVRAVVATGWGGVEVGASEDIMVIEDVPHAWLFPRVTAVVHHGGSGTTAAGLRAGRPTLVCPVLGDQPFWGARIHQLGLGPRPLPLRKVTGEALAARLAELIGSPAVASRAEAIGELIRAEDGTGAAILALEEITAERALR